MTESGQGNGQGNGPQATPQAGTPWGAPDPAPGAPGRPEQPQGGPAYGYPQPYPYPRLQPPGQGQAPSASAPPVQPPAAQEQPQAHLPVQPQPGHVVGPGFEGPGAPHGYGYPPLPEAVTQYIPPVPAAPASAHEEAATQYIAPVPPAPASAHEEAATQYIAPVPAAPASAHEEAATQYIAPVPPAPASAHEEAATQYIPPVPGAPGPDPAAGFDGLFRDDAPDAAQTRHLPPVQEPVLRRPQPRPYPPRAQGPVPPRQPYPPQFPQQPAPAQFQAAGQQFPPPAPESSRRISPAIIAAGVIGLVVAGLGVGSLLASGDGKPQNSDPGAVAAAPTASAKGSAAPGGEAPLDPAQPQAVQLDKLLADSNDSRASVIRAVDDIKGCRNLDQAANDLRAAARQREELVTRLGELKVDKLPDNAKLTASLTKAWQASADADNSYAAWADDVNGDKDKDRCKDGKAKSTGNASAGNKASGEATKAKESAAGLWNAIAAKYNLTKRDKSQL
ncbi:hypothetical protein [Streptomyces sp. NPDC091268]|uniref:hypothetical protein n=1 Tax=Streptomyces sp. NPDC091268 TaxID=3365979 RepID=UPI00381F904F